MYHIPKQWHGTSATALSVAKVLVLALVAVLISSGAAFAGTGVTLEVQDCPLRDVVKVLMQQSGKNIIVADDAKMERKIDACLKDVELDKVLDYIVGSAGVSYRKMDDGTYIIGGAQVTVPVIAPREIADVLPPIVSEPVAPPVAAEQPMVFEKIVLVHSTPSELLRLLEPGSWSGATPGLRPTPAVTLLARPEGDVRALTITTEDGRSYDPTRVNSGVNGNAVVPAIGPNGVTPGAGRTSGPGAAEQYPPGIPGYNPRPTPAPAQTTTPNAGNFLWPEGVTDARPFDLDNSIIVKGTEDGIEKFKKIVRMLDVPPKQVSIKAEFVEVSTTDIKRFGIDWSLDRIDQSFATSFLPSGNVVFGFNRGNLTAQIRAQLTNNIGRVINAPIISTINNQPAQIAIQTQIPYWETISTVVGTSVIQQATARMISISTSLSVLPRVNGDGTITMQLQPQVSDSGNIVNGPGGQAMPEVKSQYLTTQRRVANGETVVLGGFIRKNDSNSFQRVPFLADLPIVGSLFRTRARQLDEREVLIFITPTIIQSSGSGTVGDTALMP